MEKVAEWRRGDVYRKEINGKSYAEKRAKFPMANWAIAKEALLLQKLTQAGVSCVPAYADSGEWWLCSERRAGDAFHKVRKDTNSSKKIILARKLLDGAYELDKCGVIHGELQRPMANVRVDTADNLTILDFERWTAGDTSGKNMRDVAQRLFREQFIDKQLLISLGSQSREHIYTLLSKAIMSSNQSTESFSRKYIVWRSIVLLAIDMLTKYLFFDLRIGEDLWLLTPVFNTGGWRNLGVPRQVSVVLAVVVSIGLIRGWKHHHLPAWTAVFIIGGAFGNMIDRILFQGVRDMIDFHYRPVFNAADVRLTIGTALYILRVIRHRHF